MNVQRRKYDSDFKRNAVRLSESTAGSGFQVDKLKLSGSRGQA